MSEDWQDGDPERRQALFPPWFQYWEQRVLEARFQLLEKDIKAIQESTSTIAQSVQKLVLFHETEASARQALTDAAKKVSSVSKNWWVRIGVGVALVGPTAGVVIEKLWKVS